MKTNSGTAASTSSLINVKVCSTIRWNTVSPSPMYPKTMASSMSVKEIGKPTMMVTIMVPSMIRPRISVLTATSPGRPRGRS